MQLKKNWIPEVLPGVGVVPASGRVSDLVKTK
jgi:hypothetical protein